MQQYELIMITWLDPGWVIDKIRYWLKPITVEGVIITEDHKRVSNQIVILKKQRVKGTSFISTVEEPVRATYPTTPDGKFSVRLPSTGERELLN